MIVMILRQLLPGICYLKKYSQPIVEIVNEAAKVAEESRQCLLGL